LQLPLLFKDLLGCQRAKISPGFSPSRLLAESILTLPDSVKCFASESAQF